MAGLRGGEDSAEGRLGVRRLESRKVTDWAEAIDGFVGLCAVGALEAEGGRSQAGEVRALRAGEPDPTSLLAQDDSFARNAAGDELLKERDRPLPAPALGRGGMACPENRPSPPREVGTVTGR